MLPVGGYSRMTGVFEPNKACQAKSVGRVIHRGKGCNGWFVGVTPSYLAYKGVP